MISESRCQLDVQKKKEFMENAKETHSVAVRRPESKQKTDAEQTVIV